MLSLVIAPVFGAEDRYVLQSQSHNKKERISSALYFDRVEQRLVRKTFEWSKSFVQRKYVEKKDDFKFPSSTGNIADVSSEVLKEHNITATYSNIDLTAAKFKSKIVKELDEHFGSKEKGISFLRKMVKKVDDSSNKFKLISIGTSGRRSSAKDVGLYYNKERGVFVTKIIKRRKSNSTAFDFPKTLARPNSLNPGDRDSNYSLDRSNEYYARSPSEYKNVMQEIKKDFRSAGLKFQEEKFTRLLDDIKKRRIGDVLIKRIHKNNKLFRVYYNYERQEMVIQKIELDPNNASRGKLIDESIHDLSSNDGFTTAADILNKNYLMSEEDLDRFRGAHSKACLGVLVDYVFANPKSFENITDALWDKHLEESLAREMIPAGNRSMILEVNILDKKKRVKAVLNDKGEMVRLDWLDMSPEEAHKQGLKIELKIDEDGANNFSILTNYASDSWVPAIGFNTDHLKIEDGVVKGNIAVYVKGRKGTGFEFNNYEKSIYPFELSKGGDQITKLGSRERLDGRMRNNYNIDSAFVEGSGGLKDGVFKLLYSNRGRQKYVRKTIYDSALESMAGPEFKKIISNDEVWGISSKISEDLGRETRNYSTSVTDITAKGAALSYATFGDEILGRSIKDMLPGEADENINAMVLNISKPFKRCLDRASQSRSKDLADKCMEVFKVEAPVFAGREILFLKLEENGLGKYKDDVSAVYMSCIKEHYSHSPESANSTDKIKGCLFQAFLSAVEHGVGPILDTEVSKAAADQGFEFTLKSNDRSRLIGSIKTCYSNNNLQSNGAFGTKFNYNELVAMEPLVFEGKLSSCVDKVQIGAGRIVVNEILQLELKKQELPENIRKVAVDSGLEQGYEACVGIQEKIINEFKGKSRASAPAKVVAVSPGECASLVMNRSLSVVVPQLIKDAVGESLFNSLEGDGFEFMSCFDDVEKELLGNITDMIKLENSLSKSEKKENAEKRAAAADKSHALCLKKAMYWASYHGVGQTVEETLAKDPEMRKLISLTDKDKEMMGKLTQACFERELNKFEKVEEVTNSIERVTEICGRELLLHSDVQELLFTPVIVESLKEANVDEKNIKKWSASILKGMNEEMQSAKTINEIIDTAKNYKGKAVVQVVNLTLEEKLNQFIDIKDKDEKLAEVERLLKEADEKLLSSNGLNFGEKFKVATSSANPEDLKKVIGDFTLEATKLIGKEIIITTGRELVRDGLLKGEKDVKAMSDFAERLLIDCLDSKPVSGVSQDDHAEACTQKVKALTTGWVVERSLNNIMSEEENANVFDEDAKKKVIEEVLDKKTKDEISRISKISDSDESKAELKLLTVSIKSKAANQIVQKLIPYTLNDLIKVSSNPKTAQAVESFQFRENLKVELVNDFETCLDKFQGRSISAIKSKQSKSQYNSDKEFDACANQLRLATMQKVLPFKLEEILSVLNENQVENFKLNKESEKAFNTCSNKVDDKLKPNAYKFLLDGCATNAILNFARDAIGYLREEGDEILLPNESTLTKWDACIDTTKATVLEKLKKHTSVEELSSKTNTDDFIMKAFEISSQIKDSEYKPLSMNWFIDELKGCGIKSLLPSLLQEFKDGIDTNPSLKLTANEKEIAGDFLDSIDRILKSEYNGKTADFQIDDFIDGLDKKDEAVQRTDVSTSSKSSKESKPVLTHIKDFQPLINEYVKGLVNYDSDAYRYGIKQFEDKVKEELVKGNGSIPLEKVKDTLVDSKLGDIILKSLVAKIIRDKASEALEAQGVDPKDIVDKLADPQMLERIFANEAGIAAISDIKRKLKDLNLKEIFGLLDKKNIKKDSKEDHALKYLTAKIVDTLADDTDIGGFVETLLGPIIQKQLTEKRESIETGFKKVVAMPIAGWMGYNKKEFIWGDDKKNPPYALRNTPSGKQAVKNFGHYVLKPMMKNKMSNEEVDKLVKAHVEPDIKAAFGQNNLGLWDWLYK